MGVYNELNYRKKQLLCPQKSEPVDEVGALYTGNTCFLTIYRFRVER